MSNPPTVHNGARKEDVAKTVLMPGDPLRAKYIADTYLENVVKFNNVRGYFKIYVGYRFDAPKSFEKGMDWIESKNPFKKK